MPSRAKARLALSDGRTATFAFNASAGTLTAHAAIGLDQECNYALLPLMDPLPPTPLPTPTPGPAPQPNPPQPRPPAPQPQASNLRVLFTYDPATLADMPLPRQAILAAPQLRGYLEKHCPLESNCQTECVRCVRAHRVLSLPPRHGRRFRAAGGVARHLQRRPNKARAWLLVVNEAGQTVVDQTWPGSVEETLTLLEKFGGQ